MTANIELCESPIDGFKLTVPLIVVELKKDVSLVTAKLIGKWVKT